MTDTVARPPWVAVLDGQEVADIPGKDGEDIRYIRQLEGQLGEAHAKIVGHQAGKAAVIGAGVAYRSATAIAESLLLDADKRFKRIREAVDNADHEDCGGLVITIKEYLDEVYPDGAPLYNAEHKPGPAGESADVGKSGQSIAKCIEVMADPGIEWNIRDGFFSKEITRKLKVADRAIQRLADIEVAKEKGTNGYLETIDRLEKEVEAEKDWTNSQAIVLGKLQASIGLEKSLEIIGTFPERKKDA